MLFYYIKEPCGNGEIRTHYHLLNRQPLHPYELHSHCCESGNRTRVNWLMRPIGKPTSFSQYCRNAKNRTLLNGFGDHLVPCTHSYVENRGVAPRPLDFQSNASTELAYSPLLAWKVMLLRFLRIRQMFYF